MIPNRVLSFPKIDQRNRLKEKSKIMYQDDVEKCCRKGDSKQPKWDVQEMKEVS